MFLGGGVVSVEQYVETTGAKQVTEGGATSCLQVAVGKAQNEKKHEEILLYLNS